MRAAIYDPYLDTGGGGERYMMTVASILTKHGWNVEIVWPDPRIGRWLQARLGIDLSEVSFVDNVSRGAGYDLVFWLSDGSIPGLVAGRNILHFQTPFQNVGGRSLFNRLKLAKINKVVCNSFFTKKFIDKEYGVDSTVLYPPVDVELFGPSRKENIILFVGRFSQLQQQKRQDILIETFAKMCASGLTGWRLVLAGGNEVGADEFVRQLKKTARGLPIDILENAPLKKLQKHYSQAKLFWSAAGWGVDEEKDPQKVEHFGISVVEAMAAGCVPIVIAKGGHKEIIKDGKNGFLWESTRDLERITQELVGNERRRKQIAEEACKSAQKYSVDRFKEELFEIIED